MHSAGGSTTSTPAPSSDIVFACSHCATSFVVDAAAAGVTLQCQKCGKPTTVPKPAPEAPPENAVRIADLQHQLKENESQRTEITSYINQHSIQLHRWQLRLKSLNERQQKLEAELATARGSLIVGRLVRRGSHRVSWSCANPTRASSASESASRRLITLW